MPNVTSSMRGIRGPTAAAIMLAAIPMISCSTVSVDNLKRLANDFRWARSLPEGARPLPPEDVDLDLLRGLPLSTLRKAVGHLEERDRWHSWECGAPHCVAFTFGQDEHSVGGLVRNPDGSMAVTVSTGGPHLLILGVSQGGLVRTAMWQGQK